MPADRGLALLRSRLVEVAAVIGMVNGTNERLDVVRVAA